MTADGKRRQRLLGVDASTAELVTAWAIGEPHPPRLDELGDAVLIRTRQWSADVILGRVDRDRLAFGLALARAVVAAGLPVRAGRWIVYEATQGRSSSVLGIAPDDRPAVAATARRLVGVEVPL